MESNDNNSNDAEPELEITKGEEGTQVKTNCPGCQEILVFNIPDEKPKWTRVEIILGISAAAIGGLILIRLLKRPSQDVIFAICPKFGLSLNSP